VGLAGCAIAAITVGNPLWMRTAFSHTGYYLILTLAICWVLISAEALSASGWQAKSVLKEYGPGLVLSLLVSVVIFLSVKPMFRVLADETNLISISKTMTRERRVDNILSGFWYYDSFTPLRRATPKRPLMYPLLINFTHLATGYRAINAFAVNFCVLFLLLALVYALMRNALGGTWAAVSVILVAAQPLVAQTATSAGFDLLQALSLLACLYCVHRFVKTPSASGFHLLWVNLLVLANIRYEGALLAVVIIICLAALGQIKRSMFSGRTAFIFPLTPFIALLTIWQRALALQRNSFEVKSGGPAFSLEHLLRNNGLFFESIMDHSFMSPHALLIQVLGLLALAYVAFLLVTKRVALRPEEQKTALVSGVCLSVLWVIVSSLFSGSVVHPSSCRYFVVFAIGLSIAAAFLLSRIRILSENPVAAVVLALGIFAVYHPVSAGDQLSKSQTLPREYRFITRFVQQRALQDRDFVVVTERPGIISVHEIGAVGFPYANNSKGFISRYKNNLFRDIYVVQSIDYKTRRPNKKTRLKNKFILKTVQELQIGRKSYSRISKVVRLRK
jgi:hypothetical protein